MSDRHLPRYPIYIPSKGRAATMTTTNWLIRDGVPFRIVVEPPDYDAYAARFGADCLLTLPFADLGLGAVPARNWIKEHAISEGHDRHWQLDDNLFAIYRWFKSRRLEAHSGVALRVVEDLTDRYQNVALSGLNYHTFARRGPDPPTMPFWLNVHVYSCTLIDNRLPYRWRGRYNDDTDICLQVLAGGYCTISVNAFNVRKAVTMSLAGGMTTSYQGDGRLKMARALERVWPGVVKVGRRWNRPQHVINWRKFDNALIPVPGLVLSDQIDEYGLRLIERAPLQSDRLRAIVAERLATDREALGYV